MDAQERAVRPDGPPGYLPVDRPPFWTTFLSGWQVLVACFPATVLVAILTHFDIGTTLLTSGLSTIIAVLVSRNRIPFYYGSSFAYIAAVGAAVAKFGGGTEGVRIAQGGIVASGILQIVVGLLIMALGKKFIDTLLPPILTGSIAIVIGISLSWTALSMAFSNFEVGAFTLLATIAASVYLRNVRFVGLFPILIGAVAGYLFAWSKGAIDFKPLHDATWLRMPRVFLPNFEWRSVLAIAPMALATIPETTAHLYQLSLYVDKEAERQGRPPQGTAGLLGQAIAFVGLSDVINGLFGGPAGTNYGEANATMAISRNFSSWATMAGGLISICLAFIGVLAGLIQTLPTAVVGGLSIYLFGVIGKQGVALISSERVDLTDTRNLAIGAVTLVIGIGGSFFADPAALAKGTLSFTGELPINLLGIHNPPAIATAAVVGIVLNLIFTYLPIPGINRE